MPISASMIPENPEAPEVGRLSEQLGLRALDYYYRRHTATLCLLIFVAAASGAFFAHGWAQYSMLYIFAGVLMLVFPAAGLYVWSSAKAEVRSTVRNAAHCRGLLKDKKEQTNP